MIKLGLKKNGIVCGGLTKVNSYPTSAYVKSDRLAYEVLYGFSETKQRILNRKDFVWHSLQSHRSLTETLSPFLQIGNGTGNQETECARLGMTHPSYPSMVDLRQKKSWLDLFLVNKSNFAQLTRSIENVWSAMYTSPGGTWQTISRGTGRKGMTMEEH